MLVPLPQFKNMHYGLLGHKMPPAVCPLHPRRGEFLPISLNLGSLVEAAVRPVRPEDWWFVTLAGPVWTSQMNGNLQYTMMF